MGRKPIGEAALTGAQRQMLHRIKKEEAPPWRYLVLRVIDEDILNEYGSEGWELVAVTDHAAYLKRRF